MDLSEKQSKIEIFVQAKSTAALKSPHYTHFSGLNMFQRYNMLWAERKHPSEEKQTGKWDNEMRKITC